MNTPKWMTVYRDACRKYFEQTNCTYNQIICTTLSLYPIFVERAVNRKMMHLLPKCIPKRIIMQFKCNSFNFCSYFSHSILRWWLRRVPALLRPLKLSPAECERNAQCWIFHSIKCLRMCVFVTYCWRAILMNMRMIRSLFIRIRAITKRRAVFDWIVSMATSFARPTDTGCRDTRT